MTLEKKGEGRGALSLRPSVQIIQSYIIRKDGHDRPGCVAIYDKFIGPCRGFRYFSESFTIGNTALGLWHPTKPDPQPLYDRLRVLSRDGQESLSNVLAKSIPTGPTTRHHLERAIDLLREHHRDDDAAWMQSIYNDVGQRLAEMFDRQRREQGMIERFVRV